MTTIEAAVSPALADDLADLAARVAASVVSVHVGRGGHGSGVVWSPNWIVTNGHVAHGAPMEVMLADGTRFRARTTRHDASVDLALLEVEGDLVAAGAQVATVRDSSGLRPGELVVAVGHPHGERNAITLGVASGAGPFTVGRMSQPEVLRLAITLRPGNSGGALADARGRIVGIPHMVVGPGLGLAVPTTVVEQFLHGAFTPQPWQPAGVRWV